MFTDMVGYSALAGRDEKLCLELLEEHRAVVRRTALAYGGKEIKTIGDAFFIEFTSVVEAVRCAVEIQTALFERNLAVPEERRVQIRIGLHLGDIVDAEDDRFGNEINIAARIEPLARPGGISVTQQVVDQIHRKLDLPVRRLGKLKLKNIDSPPEVFQIVLPWEGQSRSPLKTIRDLLPRRTSLEGRLLGVQIGVVLAILTWVFAQLLHSHSPSVDRPSRGLASEDLHRYSVPMNWQYTLGNDETRSDSWKNFDTTHSIQYADELNGDYMLKLEFTPNMAFRHPAMVIGLVSESHRAYLNGKFIGGSQHFSDLSIYSFSSDLLQEGKPNMLLIKAHTGYTLTPGLYPVQLIPPYIGEFEDVSQVVESDDIQFHVLRSIYLVVSLLIAVASLAYCGSRKSARKYLYYSLFLFLGSLCLSYYNMFVTSALDYQAVRFMKVLAFGLSSFALCSTELHLRGKKKLELGNNALALLTMGAASITLLNHTILPSHFVTRYNGILLAITGYSIAWLSVLAIRAFDRKHRSRDTFLIFGFGVTIAMLAYASLISPSFLPAIRQEQIKAAGIVYPFVFALLVLASGLADYIRKSREISYKKRKDNLILSISALSADCTDASQTITTIQKKLAEFLQATRSTIYLSETDGGETYLKATYIRGPHGIKSHIQKVVRPGSGIIGYCMAHRSAVWVEDIRKDPRFQTEISRRLDGTSTYKTGSFIVVPLVIGAELLGVITVADRKDAKSFSRADFCVLHLVAKDLAFILMNARLGNDAKNAVVLHKRAS